MGRSDFVGKQELWLRRFSTSRLTVAEFCDREDVSVAAFCQWRRKLATVIHRPAGEAEVQVGLAVPPSSGVSNGFVPVRVRASAAIEVRLPNRVALMLPAVDPEVQDPLGVRCELVPKITIQKSMLRDGVMVAESMLEQILKLRVDERAELARQVLLSLEPNEFDDDADHAWMTENQRRREAIRRGDVQLMDWAHVRHQLISELHLSVPTNSSGEEGDR